MLNFISIPIARANTGYTSEVKPGFAARGGFAEGRLRAFIMERLTGGSFDRQSSDGASGI